LTVTINQHITKITKLETTINEITIKTNNCGKESDEWKHKYDSEHNKVTSYEKRIKELEDTVTDLKSKNAKLTGDLDSCRSASNIKDGKIRDFKVEIDGYKDQVTKLNIKIGECEAERDHATKDLSQEKKLEIQEGVIIKKLEVQLEELRSRYTGMEISYKKEQTLVENFQNQIIVLREEHSQICKKYDDDIAQLKFTFKVSIDKCEASVKSERDINASIRIQITNLLIKITEIEEKLTFSIKLSEDWQRKQQYCENETVSLKQQIDVIKVHFDDTDAHLSSCVTHTKSLQTEVTRSKSELETCSINFIDIRNKFESGEAIIVKLLGEIGNCEAGRKRSEAEVAALQCEVSKFLTEIEGAEDRAITAILEVKGLFDGNKAALGKFVKSQNIGCKTCGHGEPCLEAVVSIQA